jgi:hypothetical protein
VKHLVISKLAPGIDNARKALEVYGKAGLIPGTEATWAGADGKTFRWSPWMTPGCKPSRPPKPSGADVRPVESLTPLV